MKLRIFCLIFLCLTSVCAAEEGYLCYVNPYGGVYYHTEPDCDSMREEYHEKMMEVPLTRLKTSDYRRLSACTQCHQKPYPKNFEMSENEIRRNNSFIAERQRLENQADKLYRQFAPQEIVKISELEAEYGLDLLEEVYIAPAAEDLPAAEISACAQTAVQEAFGWQNKELTVYQCSLFHYKESDTVYWYVSFAEGGYCLLTRDGEVTEDRVHGRFTPQEQFARYGAVLTMAQVYEYYGRDTWYLWPKAEQELLEEFSAPAKNAISEYLAKQLALKEAGLLDRKDEFKVYAMYLSNDQWRVLIYRGFYDLRADVYMDAFTGEVVQIYKGAGNG